jgi:hypothetical protein
MFSWSASALPAHATRAHGPSGATHLCISLVADSASNFTGAAYYLTPTQAHTAELEKPSLAELARVIKAGACIEATCKRGKSEVGMDEYQVRTWEGWHHHMALALMAVWFLIGETHRGQQVTPALTLPQVRYGLSVLLLEVFYTPGVDSICRQVQRQLLRNELARFYHHRTRKCIPPRKLRREIQ